MCRAAGMVPVFVLGVACAASTATPTDIPTPTPTVMSTPTPITSPDPTPIPAMPNLAVTPDVVTSEVAESDQVNDEGLFLQVIAPLDEARGYCLDIPGHRTGVRLERPLHVHTCKHGIWNYDGRFDLAALGNGMIRMPHYELCLGAENTSIGARLFLAECS